MLFDLERIPAGSRTLFLVWIRPSCAM